MAFYIRDERTDKAVRRLAGQRGKTITEVVRDAVEAELEKDVAKYSVSERIDALTREFVAKHPPTGLKADKAFYDSLCGEEDH